jgi:hypothetical protein
MRVLGATRDWFRNHRPTTRTVRLAGAFAATFLGGTACAGVMFASWNASWNAMSGTPTETARSAPRKPISTTGVSAEADVAPAANQPRETAKGAERKEAERKTAAAAGKPSPRKASCEDQAWPYLDQRCLDRNGESASGPVRVISPDNRNVARTAPEPSGDRSKAVGSRLAGAAQTASAPAETSPSAAPAPASPPLQLSPVTSASAAAPPPPTPEPHKTTRDPVRVPTSKPLHVDRHVPPEQAAKTSPMSETPAAAEPEPPQTAGRGEPSRREAYRDDSKETSRSSRSHRRNEPRRRTATRQRDADDDESTASARRVDEPTRARRDRDDEPGSDVRRNDRDVRITRTYVMRDGRRVTVTQIYRRAPAHFREPGMFSHRPYGVVPRGYAVVE